jgi:hypothetical protein
MFLRYIFFKSFTGDGLFAGKILINYWNQWNLQALKLVSSGEPFDTLNGHTADVVAPFRSLMASPFRLQRPKS